MGTWKPSDEPLEVEELRFGSWAGPGSGPAPPNGPADGWETPGPGSDEPTPFERAGAWLRAHVRPLAIGAGALAAVLLVASIVTGPDGSPDAAPDTTATVPPSTTEPQAVTSRPPRTSTTTSPVAANGAGAAADVDYRMVVRELPGGYEATGIDVVPDDIIATPWSSAMLFAPVGASWTTGPWLMITSAPRDQGGVAGEPAYTFTRPPTSLTIGGWPALAGRGYGGRDKIILQNETSTVLVVHRGLDLAATTAVVEASTFGATTIDVPSTALPPGFVAVESTDLELWLTAWAPDVRAFANYNRIGQDGFISVLALPADADHSMNDGAPFFVDDLHYVTIDGDPGFAGTASIAAFTEPQLIVSWRHEGRELVAITSVDLTLSGAIELASQVVTPDDRDWSDDAWQEALADAADCCEVDSLDNEMSYAIEAFGAPEGDDWQLILYSSNGSVGWNFQSQTDGFGGSTPRAGNVLQVASTFGVAFGTETYHAGAMAILDRAQLGATLRLTTTGSAPQTIEVPLQPVEGSELLAPFIAGGAILPWTDGGFVAQVIAPDGTVILTQSDTDLP